MTQSKSVWKDLWQMDLTLLYSLRFWSLTLLRLFLGVLFMYHGALRLFVPTNLSGSITYFAQTGIPFAQYSVYAFGVIEIVGGALLFLGLFTRWAAFVMMLEMAYILFRVHWKSGFLVSNNGYEFVLLLVFALLFVLVNGAGHLSLGKLTGKE